MNIGFLQFQPQFGSPKANMDKVEELTQAHDFDLMVLPELAHSGYVFSSMEEVRQFSETVPDGAYCMFLRELAQKKGAYLVSGLCEQDEGQFYNSSVLVCPDGKIDVYRKLHLFYEETLWFTPGNIPLTVHEISGAWGVVKIGMMICFDWQFPEVTRTLALKGAQIICHPSNLVMPFCQDAMVTRALENHVFTITANRTGADIRPERRMSFTGKSEIVGPKGNVLYKAQGETEECTIVRINPKEALDKSVNHYNDAFKDRREEFYK